MGADKLLHFWMSFLLAMFDPMLAWWVGIGKEVWDAVSGGVADVWDLAADAAGIVFSIWTHSV